MEEIKVTLTKHQAHEIIKAVEELDAQVGTEDHFSERIATLKVLVEDIQYVLRSA